MKIQEAGAAGTGSRLYVAGGYDVARNSSSAVFVFDGSTWQRGPSLPIAVNHPGVAAIGSDVYVAGGFTPGGATNRAFVLSAGSASWRELAPMEHARGTLRPGRARRVTCTRSADVMAACRSPRPRPTARGAGTWTLTSDMPAPRNHLAGYVDGSELSVSREAGPPFRAAAIDCLDPPTGDLGAPGNAADGDVRRRGQPLMAATTDRRGRRTGRRDEHRRRRPGARGGVWTNTPMLVPGTAPRLPSTKAGSGCAVVRPRPASMPSTRVRRSSPRSPDTTAAHGFERTEVVDEPEQRSPVRGRGRRGRDRARSPTPGATSPGGRGTAPTSASLPSARRHPRSWAIRRAITASLSASLECSEWKPISTRAPTRP